MARVALPLTVVDAAGNAIQGASVRVKKRSDGSDATLYAAEAGATTAANPVATNTQGRTGVWVDRGAYNCTVTGTGIVTYTEPFDAAPAGDNAVDTIWASQVFPARVTTLPASPFDGQIVAYVADAVNGVVWMLKYNAGSASTYKWEYLGGGALVSEVIAAEAISNTVYAALTTAGPSITVPLAGDYEVSHGSRSSGNSGNTMKHSYDIGGTAAVDADATQLTIPTNSTTLNVSRTRRKNGLTANTALVSKYTSTAAIAGNFGDRWMRVVPIRVG